MKNDYEDSKDKKYKIKHDRVNCIGCSACASVCPRFWEMNGEDFKADLVGSGEKEEYLQAIEIGEEDFKCNMDAAESCPVNVIHIVNLESGEELI